METLPKPLGERPAYPCRKVMTGFHLEKWQDSDWTIYPVTSPFILLDGSGPATYQTKVRAVWTQDALYVAFWCHDPEPWATFTERDADLYEEEVVEVFLNPWPEDETSYFEFEINPLGTLFDARIHWTPGGIEVDRLWDCAGLVGAVRAVPGLGWRAGLRIPFYGLGYHPAPGEVWAVNFYRIERRPRVEFSSWAPILTRPPSFHSPSSFGRLRFTEG
ncbi:MAG: hypothetical protein GX493_06750 [Firmicutes bacterium]|nr:hypothetical protein [Bacillota bacterium]